MLAEAYKRERLTADLVTHVPLHAARRRQRGYDQSQLLAREMARQLGLPFLPDAVKRVRATRAANTSGRRRPCHQRRASLRARRRQDYRRRIKDRRILLIDDVTATGSTLDATAAALAEARPAAIIGLALSRPNGASFS